MRQSLSQLYTKIEHEAQVMKPKEAVPYLLDTMYKYMLTSDGITEELIEEVKVNTALGRALFQLVQNNMNLLNIPENQDLLKEIVELAKQGTDIIHRHEAEVNDKP